MASVWNENHAKQVDDFRRHSKTIHFLRRNEGIPLRESIKKGTSHI